MPDHGAVAEHFLLQVEIQELRRSQRTTEKMDVTKLASMDEEKKVTMVADVVLPRGSATASETCK